MITNIFKYQRHILSNSWNELRYRYAGTAIGFLWNFGNPLLEALIYTIVFSQIIRLRTGIDQTGPYILFLTAGLFPWISFAEGITQGSISIVKNAGFLRRLAIPTEIFVAISSIVSASKLHVYFFLLIVINLLLNNSLGWALLLLPIIGILLHGLSFGMTLILANLRVLIPDLGEVLRALIQLWRWTMPIIYAEDILPENIRFLFLLNPPYIYIKSIRQIFLDQSVPSVLEWGIMIAWVFLFIVLGSIITRKLEVEVKDAV